jgi:hypothetical protein
MSMKKIIVALIISLVFSLCACGKSNKIDVAETTTTENVTMTEMTTAEESATIENKTTEITTTEEKNKLSKTEEAYKIAANLTIKDLSYHNGHYKYKDIDLLQEENDWIESPRNEDNTVEKGALYRKMAMLLEGYELGNDISKYDKHIFGFTASSRDELKPYVDNASQFIVTSDDLLTPVMEKFCTLSSVSDYSEENKIYHFTIPDLSACAEEMQISEEMLGYIFDMLDMYGSMVSFDDNSCTFDLDQSWRN